VERLLIVAVAVRPPAESTAEQVAEMIDAALDVGATYDEYRQIVGGPVTVLPVWEIRL
jgi:hypothetical protein